MQKHRQIPNQRFRAPSKPLTANGEHSELPSTRWWEAYAVRYFIGFVIGTVCVAILIEDLGLTSQLQKLNSSGLQEIGSISYLLLAVLGLGYCYAASTPISVLHFGRYGRGCIDRHARHFWFGWLLSIVFFSIFGADVLGSDLSCYALTLLIGVIGTAVVSPHSITINVRILY